MTGATRYPQPIRHPRTTRVTCGHRVYGMNCVDLDALYERASYACEICKRPETTNPLNIDHDAFLGRYAVRGLLRGGCNGSIGGRSFPAPFDSTPAAKRFLDNPWWARPGGPRPLGPATWAPDVDGNSLHVTIGNVSKIGKQVLHGNCGMRLASRSGYQLWQVIDSRICVPCVKHGHIEIQRLEYYRTSPHAFNLSTSRKEASG